MFEVFISYSTKDQGIAEKVCRVLEENGLSCWIAPRNIVPGSHWEASIVQSIENAEIFLLVYTQNSNASNEVSRELSLASYGNTDIIPLLLDAVKPDPKLAYSLAGRQWFEGLNAPLEEAIQGLVAVIKEKLSIEKAEPEREQILTGLENMLDVYDENGEFIAFSTRELVHTKGLWHKTFHCWFIEEEGGKQYVWVQKRSRQKKDFPGLFDITAARHLLHGESDRDGIGKIHLELGVDVDFKDTVFLGTRTYSEKREGFYNREFNSVYLYDAGQLVKDILVCPEEVEGLVRIEIDKGLALFSLELPELTVPGLFYEGGRMVPREIKIGNKDFVPRKDNYYMKIFASAKQFFLGNKYLSI